MVVLLQKENEEAEVKKHCFFHFHVIISFLARPVVFPSSQRSRYLTHFLAKIGGCVHKTQVWRIEWAKSLIGLCMQVEEGWWDGCSVVRTCILVKLQL
jgi:hypothetical protein